MKIRLSEQSLRIRLSSDDIENLERQSLIRYALLIGNQALRIRLNLVRQPSDLSAVFVENEISVSLEETALEELKNDVSISKRQQQEEIDLSILIEKDGTCKH